MIIEYINTLEHIETFTRYHINRSRYGLMLKYILRLLIPIIFAVIIVLDAISGRVNLVLIIIFAVISVTWFFLSPSVLQRSLMKQMKKIYERDLQKGGLARKRITLDDRGISEDNANIRSVYPWERINKVVILEKYIIIYVTALEAQIIPLESIPNGHEQSEIEAIVKKNFKGSLIYEK